MDAEIDKAIPEMGCCGVQGELAKVREHLEKDWMVKVKAVLKAHGLTAKLHEGMRRSQEMIAEQEALRSLLQGPDARGAP